MAGKAGKRSGRGGRPTNGGVVAVRDPSQAVEQNWDAPVDDGEMDTDEVPVEVPTQGIGRAPEWYTKADQYWKNVEPTVNGMLGGYEVLSEPDAACSLEFIREFVEGPTARLQRNLALDCGAGIGRVSREFLLKVFEKVDLVEQNPLFVEQAKSYVPEGRVERFICSGLQNFTPEHGRYDAIWSQWVLDDFVAFFRRCQSGLRANGLIFVKENIAKRGFVIDEDDSSMTRSDAIMRRLFARAGLRILKQIKQPNFPKEIFAVHIYALDFDR